MKALSDVTAMFISKRVFADQSSADKYIVKMCGKSKKTLEKEGMEFNDFLSIFLKGILKEVVSAVAESVKDFQRSDVWAQNADKSAKDIDKVSH